MKDVESQFASSEEQENFGIFFQELIFCFRQAGLGGRHLVTALIKHRFSAAYVNGTTANASEIRSTNNINQSSHSLCNILLELALEQHSNSKEDILDSFVEGQLQASNSSSSVVGFVEQADAEDLTVPRASTKFSFFSQNQDAVFYISLVVAFYLLAVFAILLRIRYTKKMLDRRAAVNGSSDGIPDFRKRRSRAESTVSKTTLLNVATPILILPPMESVESRAACFSKRFLNKSMTGDKLFKINPSSDQYDFMTASTVGPWLTLEIDSVSNSGSAEFLLSSDNSPSPSSANSPGSIVSSAVDRDFEFSNADSNQQSEYQSDSTIHLG